MPSGESLCVSLIIYGSDGGGGERGVGVWWGWRRMTGGRSSNILRQTITHSFTATRDSAQWDPTEQLGAPTKNRCPFVLGLPCCSASAVFHMLHLLYFLCAVQIQQHLKCFTSCGLKVSAQTAGIERKVNSSAVRVVFPCLSLYGSCT